jgi:hypothetical protein
MFKPWQAISFLIAFVVLVGGAFYWYYSAPTGTESTNMNVQQPAAPATGDASASAPSTNNTNTAVSNISASGNSDASLDTDLNTVDTQLQAVSHDSAAVDQSFNDKAIPQTE